LLRRLVRTPFLSIFSRSVTDPYPSHTCKTRHSRCDEKKPICGNCARLNLECKSSDFIAESPWTVATTDENSPSYTIPTSAEAQHSLSDALLPNAPLSTWDIFRSRISGLDLVSDESPPNDVLAHLDLVFPRATPTPPPRESPVSLTPETAFLLQTYLRTVATWMDLMDHSKTYELCIPRLTLTSPLLFHCVCAFTAKYLALSDPRRNASWSSTAFHHYGESLRLLIHALNAPSYDHALTATILLSSYEILAGIASERHRRHLLGQTMLVKHHNVTAQSTGIDRANFWLHVRHEIGFAMATGRPLLLDPGEWNVNWKQGETREDVLGNHVLWILARVINLIYGEESCTSVGKQKRKAFLQELEQWRAGLSDTFIGIPYGPTDSSGFRKIFFTVTAAGKSAVFKPYTYPKCLHANIPQPLEPSGITSRTYSSTRNPHYSPLPMLPSSRNKLFISPTSLSQSFLTRYGCLQVMGCFMRRSISTGLRGRRGFGVLWMRWRGNWGIILEVW